MRKLKVRIIMLLTISMLTGCQNEAVKEVGRTDYPVVTPESMDTDKQEGMFTPTSIPVSPEDYFSYELNGGRVIITGLREENLEAVHIPNKIDGCPVGAIANDAFRGYDALSALVIPEGVSSIGENAFNNCLSLRDIVIPNSVKEIGYGAFINTEWIDIQRVDSPLVIVNDILIDGTSATGDVVVPASVKIIGTGAFYGCEKMSNIVIPETVTEIRENVFVKCSGLLSVKIPRTVIRISEGAFKGCNSLQTIELPFVGESENADAEKAVLGYIFGYETAESNYTGKGFQNEKPIEIPGTTWQYTVGYDNDVYSKGNEGNRNYHYYIPSSLKEVVISKQISIPTAAFNGCENLVKITYLIEADEKIDIGTAAFQNCKRLEFSGENGNKLEISSKVNSIGEAAFANCKNIKEIVVPDVVRSIGKGAFEGCEAVEKATLPFVGRSENAEEESAVLGYIFGYEVTETEFTGYGFQNKKPVDVLGATWQYTNGYDETPHSIGGAWNRNYHYHIPSNLKEVVISKQTSIPTAAFNGCENLVKITYLIEADEKIDIGTAAFQNCKRLEFSGENGSKLEISNKVNSIGDAAFANCKNIKEIVVSNVVRSIGKGAFEGCEAVEKATLPFVGRSESAEEESAVLGYIFGYEVTETEFTGYGFQNKKPVDVPGATWQYTIGYDETPHSIGGAWNKNYYYYIPSGLTEVIVNRQTNIPKAAFNGCSNLVIISIPKNSTIGDYAFQKCTAKVVKE